MGPPQYTVSNNKLGSLGPPLRQSAKVGALGTPPNTPPATRNWAPWDPLFVSQQKLGPLGPPSPPSATKLGSLGPPLLSQKELGPLGPPPLHRQQQLGILGTPATPSVSTNWVPWDPPSTPSATTNWAPWDPSTPSANKTWGHWDLVYRDMAPYLVRLWNWDPTSIASRPS